MRSRTDNTKRNILVSYAFMIIQLLAQFVLRSAIVYTLGAKYLGLSSLFTSVLGVLNIAELGFTTSIVYFMYKPLAEGDVQKVNALLMYLKKVYIYVGIVILTIGGAITPIIRLLVKGDVPQDINIYILYIMYLVNTVLGYFLYAHKTALLTAMQRLDITKVASGVVMLFQYILQAIALYVFGNYYLFVLGMILGTAGTNLFTAMICKKQYPEYFCKGQIDNDTQRDIISKVKGMMICNVSSVTYTTLDSIIISIISGLSLVAVYNNYIVIFSSVTSIILVIRVAMQASVGNSVATETIEKNYNDILTWQLGFSFICTFCMSCMICLYQPFMIIWMGESYLLPFLDVILISVWFYVSNVQNAFFLYLMGDGLFNEMKWAYIFSTCFNLGMNLLLGKTMGITGIIIASLLSCLISGTFWQCIIIFKQYFKKSSRNYIITQFKYFIIAVIISTAAFLGCSCIRFCGWLALIVKLVVCSIITISLLILVYKKNPYYKTAKAYMMSFRTRLKRPKKENT